MREEQGEHTRLVVAPDLTRSLGRMLLSQALQHLLISLIMWVLLLGSGTYRRQGLLPVQCLGCVKFLPKLDKILPMRQAGRLDQE